MIGLLLCGENAKTGLGNVIMAKIKLIMIVVSIKEDKNGK